MKRFLTGTGLVVIVLLLSLSGFAKSKTDNVTLVNDATLSGKTIPAGEYVVKYEVDGTSAQVKFLKGSKEIASANGQVKNLTRKPGSTQVVVNTEGNARSISEIQFGGKETAISFDSAGMAAGK